MAEGTGQIVKKLGDLEIISYILEAINRVTYIALTYNFPDIITSGRCVSLKGRIG